MAAVLALSDLGPIESATMVRRYGSATVVERQRMQINAIQHRRRALDGEGEARARDAPAAARDWASLDRSQKPRTRHSSAMMHSAASSPSVNLAAREAGIAPRRQAVHNPACIG
jgi:hypothetical protein